MSGKSIILVGILILVTNAMTAVFVARTPAVERNIPVRPEGGNAVGTELPRQPASPNFPAIFAELNTQMTSWPKLLQADKVAAVDMAIRMFRERENTAILKSPEFYAKRLDEMITANPTMKSLNLPTLLKIVSVMEYDFYNGQDKEALARNVLGPQLYEQNRQRLGLQKQS